MDPTIEERKLLKREYDRIRYIKNIEEITIRHKKYRDEDEHKVKMAEYGKEWAILHPDAIKLKLKRYYERHPDKIMEKNKKRSASGRLRECQRNSHLKIFYGLSLDKYNEMYEAQEGKCLICGEHKDKLMVDHDHKTNKVRGLLCTHCNTGIGFLKDNVNNLKKAIDYLEKRG